MSQFLSVDYEPYWEFGKQYEPDRAAAKVGPYKKQIHTIRKALLLPGEPREDGLTGDSQAAQGSGERAPKNAHGKITGGRQEESSPRCKGW